MRRINKKAAIELSIGTIVIIVLAMSMLILGLVLVRSIFKGATTTVDILNDKVAGEVANLFVSEGEDVVVKLGADQTARIAAGTTDFGIAIGSRTLDGTATTRERLNFKLSLEAANGKNCISPGILGDQRTKALFITSLNTQNKFDKFQGSNTYARIQINIPKGTATCTQKVFIDVTDTKDNSIVGGSFFVVEVIQSGIFG